MCREFLLSCNGFCCELTWAEGWLAKEKGREQTNVLGIEEGRERA